MRDAEFVLLSLPHPEISRSVVDAICGSGARPRVVIETSGVALPADVQIVLFGPGGAEWVSEEAVVTVVDSDRLHVGEERLVVDA